MTRLRANSLYGEVQVLGIACTLLKIWSPNTISTQYMTAEGQQEHTDPVPAVDFIIRNDNNSNTNLVRRTNAPFNDILSIPGRFINREEIAEDALRRRAKEEAFLVVKPIAIGDLYCEAERESMMSTISITVITKLVQGDEAARDDLAAVQRSNEQEAEESLKVK